MRLRFALVAPLLATLLALVLPTTTLAAAYTYTVQKNTCSVYGGDYGYGHLYYKVRINEYGWSGANKFTFAAKLQHRSMGSSRWQTEWNIGTFTYKFRNDGDSDWYSRWYSYDPADFAYHRFKVTLKVWNGGYLLASKTLLGKTC